MGLESLLVLHDMKRSLVMTTSKPPGAHIWQIYLADLPHPVEASSGEEWQFKISVVKAHIGRSSGRSNPPTNQPYLQ